MHLLTVFLVYVISLMFLSDRKGVLNFSFILEASKNHVNWKWGFWFQNGTLRP